MHNVRYIAAIDDQNGLAKNQKLPWKIPTDQHFFRSQLTSAANLMGWNTFATNKHRPYVTNQRTFVVTDRQEDVEGVELVYDLADFIESFNEDLWVVGGGQIFSQLLDHATELVLTRVKGDYDCDVVFPAFERDFKLAESGQWQTENGYEFQFQTWIRK